MMMMLNKTKLLKDNDTVSLSSATQSALTGTRCSTSFVSHNQNIATPINNCETNHGNFTLKTAQNGQTEARVASSANILDELSRYIKIEHFPGAVEFTFRGIRQKNAANKLSILALLFLAAIAVSVYFWTQALIGLKLIFIVLSLVCATLFLLQAQKMYGSYVLRFSQRGISLRSLPMKRKGDFKRPIDMFRNFNAIPKNSRLTGQSKKYALHGLMTTGEDVILISTIRNAKHAEYIQNCIYEVIGYTPDKHNH